jgi:hypothetical protein
VEKVTNISGEVGQFIAFKWIGSSPLLAVNGLYMVYEIDLSKSLMTNIYTPQDPSLPVNLVTTYSNDGRLIYITMVDKKTAVSTIRVWNTSAKGANFTKEIFYNTTFILDLKPSRDNMTIISIGIAPDNSTKVQTFDLTGTIKTKRKIL